MELSDSLAEKYRKTPKRPKNKNKISLGGEFRITGEELISDEYGDIFKLDLRKNKIELKALTLNTRAKDVFVLARLCASKTENTKTLTEK